MLDENGLKIKTYSDLLDDMTNKCKESFGENTNLSPRSFLGVLIRIVAWFLSIVWQVIEKVYDSAYPTRAEGVQLDRLTPFFYTSRQLEKFAVHKLDFVGTPNFVILKDTSFEKSPETEFALMDNVELDDSGFGTGYAMCLQIGSIGNVGLNTIVIQSEPSADIFSVTNTEIEEYGQDYEEDPALLNRMLRSGASGGYGNPDAVLSAVLNVSGVRTANIEVNNTNAPVNGLPPKSYQVFALGGNGQDIAKEIWDKGPGGIESFGESSFYVNDLSGQPQLVRYTKAALVDIVASLEIVTDNTFQTSGIDDIKNTIVALIGGTTTDGMIKSGLGMGDTVFVSRLNFEAMKIQGVVDIQTKIGKTIETLSTENITIAKNEVGQIKASDITVTVTI